MPTIREYRVVLPLSVEEFEKARRWHKVEQLKLEIKLLQDDSVKVMNFGERTLFRENTKDIPNFYSNTPMKEGKVAEHLIKGYGSCSEAPSAFPIFSEIGSFFDVIVSDTIKLTEVESWEAYPYFRSKSVNRSLSKYQMTIEGVSMAGNGASLDNPLDLPESVLKERKLILVDISKDVAIEDYRDKKDPILFRSEKTGRGPLEPGAWMEVVQPCLTCYILISIEFDFMGPLGKMAERRLHRGIHRAMALHHRELFCYIDEWIDLSENDLAQTAELLQMELDELIKSKFDGAPAPEPLMQQSTPAPNISKEDGDKSVEPQASENSAVSAKKCGCPIEMMKSMLFPRWNSGLSHGFAYTLLGFLACILIIILGICVKSL